MVHAGDSAAAEHAQTALLTKIQISDKPVNRMDETIRQTAHFAGGIALSFWYIYLTDRAGRWWAIIPGGVLTALSLLIFASS